jgi:hypothetical protein
MSSRKRAIDLDVGDQDKKKPSTTTTTTTTSTTSVGSSVPTMPMRGSVNPWTQRTFTDSYFKIYEKRMELPVMRFKDVSIKKEYSHATSLSLSPYAFTLLGNYFKS